MLINAKFWCYGNPRSVHWPSKCRYLQWVCSTFKTVLRAWALGPPLEFVRLQFVDQGKVCSQDLPFFLFLITVSRRLMRTRCRKLTFNCDLDLGSPSWRRYLCCLQWAVTLYRDCLKLKFEKATKTGSEFLDSRSTSPIWKMCMQVESKPPHFVQLPNSSWPRKAVLCRVL